MTGLATLNVEHAAAALAKCRSVDEVKDIRDKAKAIAAYQRTRGAGQQAAVDAAEIVVLAECRLGELAREVPKARGAARPRGTPEVPRLAEKGFSKNQSSRWQRAASVPAAIRNKYLAAARAKGQAPSSTALAELAALPAAKQREVIERSSTRVGNVRALVRQVEKAAVAEKLNAETPLLPAAPFRVIVSDPPWAYDKRAGDATHRGDLPYPSMTTDEICALDVPSFAHDDAVLWLWTTNAFMRDAYRVLDAWGFREKTILTWAKDRMGLGDWLRGQTEHCILAVRGAPVVTLTNQTTLLAAPAREHSRKPDAFYALVESLCPGSRVEMFARQARAEWALWGAETEKFIPGETT